MNTIELKVKRVRQSGGKLPLPSYQSAHASGMDLIADIENSVVLEPGQRRLIPTGISVEVPIGYELQIRPRSGLALKKGISLVNTPGTVDADYRGEVCVIVINLGGEVVQIERGERIAQMVLTPVCRAQVVEVSELSYTGRDTGGFGSTGD